MRFTFRSFRRALWGATVALTAIVLTGCSGEGPEITDPDAGLRNQTAMIAVEGSGGGEITHYYEVSGTIEQAEYEAVNGQPLGMSIDAIYERYEKLWLHGNDAGTITVLDLTTRQELGRITGFPTGDSGGLNGMAFSNLSQGWAIAYGSGNLFHIDARNFALVRAIPLPGEPTAITTIDNRIFVGLETADGAGAIGLLHSNDPDLAVQIIATLPRPPIFLGINSDKVNMPVVMPGEEADDPATPEIDTDLRLTMIDLQTYQIPYQGRLFAPPLREYVGLHPNYAALTEDFFLYLATPDGVKQIDTKAWGSIANFITGGSYSVVAADYWTDLVYAVPTATPTSVERWTKDRTALPAITLDNPARSIRFVSSSKVVR